MAKQILVLSALLGQSLFFAGCSSLDRSSEPQISPVESSLRHVSAPPTVDLVTFDKPAESRLVDSRSIDSRLVVSPELLPHSQIKGRVETQRVQNQFAVPQRAETQRAETQLANHPHLNNQLANSQLASATFQPRTIQGVLNPTAENETIEPESSMIDLDMTGALSMATGQNPQIAFAAARYREAYARLDAAQTLWLPTIRFGVSANHHDGTLQTSKGNVINASRSSFQSGLGSQAVGAGSPAVPGLSAQFHASDIVFQPKIAAHSASAQNAATRVTTNDTLLATALAYLDLLRTTQQLRISEETQANANDLANLTSTFATTGQGSQADADRARTELIRRRNDVSRSQEKVRVANVRLAEFLSLDPFLEISPLEPTIVPIDLVSLDVSPGELVATGLENRPELAEAQYLVCEAVYRYRREKYAPMLPSVLLGVSQSGFGGGLGSRVDNYRGRFDFDASVYWELRNLGWGERAKRDETRSQYDQARALQISMMDRVAREVVEAHEQVKSRKSRIGVSELGVRSATDSYKRDLQRIREGQGLPIEVLQSIRALDDARGEYLRSLADYNEAQFRLQRALGWPIQ